MNITINTDASFNSKYKIGTFAYWITSDDGRFKWHGPLKGRVEDSTHAEMMCICKAMKRIKLDRDLLPRVARIIINTDSLNAIHLFNQDLRKITKYRLHKDYYKAISKIFLQMKHAMGKHIIFKHVKAHNGTEDSRSYVNDWADQKCKEEMNKLITKIENEAERKKVKDESQSRKNVA